jgi:riboflavin transporter FmnP
LLPNHYKNTTIAAEPMRRSRWVSLVALFTAMAVVLNGLTVPAPYAGFLLYGIWEIPVLLALLLLGPGGGVAVAALNGMALEFINPGGLPTGPLYNFMAEVSMFAGILLARKFVKGRGTAALMLASTVLGAAARTGVMTIVNWAVLAQPYPIGFGSFGVTESAVPGLLTLIAIFNATVTLYVVPAAYGASRAVVSRSGAKGGLRAEGFTS